MIKNAAYILLVTLPVILSLVFLGWRFREVQKVSTVSNHTGSAKEPSSNRFGFLGQGGIREYSSFGETGAGWIHPYLGPFIWGKMQKRENENISFSETDKTIISASNNNLSVLATLWSYADWDLRNKPNIYTCEVAKDAFELEFGRFRCNPSDTILYEKWVAQTVERYDGDGIDDMPNLPLKVKHWEVLSEPDLEQFYKDKPRGYGSLLMITYEAIRKADPEAKVLIGGASGGDQKALDFYKEIFASNQDIKDYFDIANIHSPQNDFYDSLNVEPYKLMLQNEGVEKPVWVTQVETTTDQKSTIDAKVLETNTKKALELGVEKIFYINTNFESEIFKEIFQKLY